jgi:catechol 2,3-dioxygenase-like lactoylglutathione lyase family enzyme
MADPLDALRLPIVPIDPRPELAAALLNRIESGEGGEREGTPEFPRAGVTPAEVLRAEVSAAVNAAAEVPREVPTEVPTVRYFVNDLEAAVSFYRDQLDFEEELRPSPAFAMLYRADLRLLLSMADQSHILPDGTLPEPGGWNRISLQVTDLASTVDALRRAGARFRADIVTRGVIRHALVEDPSGNFVELFEPLPGYHARGRNTANTTS